MKFSLDRPKRINQLIKLICIGYNNQVNTEVSCGRRRSIPTLLQSSAVSQPDSSKLSLRQNQPVFADKALLAVPHIQQQLKLPGNELVKNGNEILIG